MSTENNTTPAAGFSEETLYKYAREFVAGPGAKAVASVGFNQNVAGHFAAYVLVQEGLVEEENRKDVAKILNSFGLGTNASQIRQKLEKKEIIGKRATATDDLFE